ncbi:MAG: type II toxin-antitoxin system RelE/ParE family toxin [Bacteroidota bacterium]
MDKKYEVIFLEEAIEFLTIIDEKAREKIIYNIDKSTYYNDPKLFKKLNEFIWEFRTLYQKRQYRLLAFWDKTNAKKTLVISTHGFIKKQSKVERKEILKAETIRKNYFDNKDE